MPWTVRLTRELVSELDELPAGVRTEILAHARILEQFGPNLGRPWVGTLNGSRYANMKELRFSLTAGPWRVAFAFDPLRQAILLAGGCKAGMSERVFYGTMIRRADARYAAHLLGLARKS